MRKLILAGIASLGLIVAPAQAEDAYDTQPYTLAAMAVSGSVAGENFGGTSFAAPGFAPLIVRINDASMGAVPVSVGQDLAGAIPGSIDPAEGDAWVNGCGEVDLTDSTVAFDPSKEITVFVNTVDIGCPGAVGTTGTAELFVQM